MKQALTIGVYDPALIHQASPYCGDNVFAKGLEANGYEVHRLDYRSVPHANTALAELCNRLIAESKPPEIVWLGKCEKLTSTSILFLKRTFPNAIIIKWAADVRETPSDHDICLLDAGVDWFFATFGGSYLRSHLRPGMRGVGSIFTFTDSSYYIPQEVDEKYQSDILWTGRRGFGDNPLRNEVIDSLTSIVAKQAGEAKNKQQLAIRMFGHDGRSWIGDPDYVKFINGAKVGIGSNSFNRSRYSSDRLGNYMSCGTFYLTQYVEGIEDILERGIDIDWFYTVEEMHEKIKFYLSNPQLRDRIAQQGRQKILKFFDCKPLIQTLLDIVHSNAKQHPWEDVYTSAD